MPCRRTLAPLSLVHVSSSRHTSLFCDCRGNKQLSCYDTNGNRLWVSVDEERLKGHTDIDFDTRGDIIVCDYTNQQLHVYAWRNGEEAGGGGRGSVPRYSRSFSSKGFGPGRVMFPSAIASARGQLWVLDEYTARVQRFE